MIIAYVFGWHILKLKTKRPSDLSCYNCSKTGETNVTKYVKFVHFMYVPLFPYWIINEFECVRCRSVIDYDEMGTELKPIFHKYRSIKPPIWSFSGLIIIMGLIIYGFIPNIPDKEVLVARIQKAEKDRVIDYKTEEGEYSSFKICGSDEEKLFIVYHQFQSTDIRDLQKIREPKFYSKDTIIIDKSEVLNQIEEGIIVGVHW